MDSAQTFATVEMPGLIRTLNTFQVSASARFTVRAKSGTIHVRYVQVKGTADTVGRAEISLDIVKGYTYYASLTRDRAGVTNYCIGCSGWLTFPMIGSQRAPTDLLRLNYIHGLPLCKGCVALRTNVGIGVAKRD